LIRPPGTSSGAKRRFFDAWAFFYDLRFVKRLSYCPVHDAVVRVLRHHEPRNLLDLGCGTGPLHGGSDARFRAPRLWPATSRTECCGRPRSTAAATPSCGAGARPPTATESILPRRSIRFPTGRWPSPNASACSPRVGDGSWQGGMRAVL
jgi:hypothetical protein